MLERAHHRSRRRLRCLAVRDGRASPSDLTPPARTPGPPPATDAAARFTLTDAQVLLPGSPARRHAAGGIWCQRQGSASTRRPPPPPGFFPYSATQLGAARGLTREGLAASLSRGRRGSHGQRDPCQVATRQGLDTADFPLFCFGGAAAQHACRVAPRAGRCAADPGAPPPTGEPVVRVRHRRRGPARGAARQPAAGARRRTACRPRMRASRPVGPGRGKNSPRTQYRGHGACRHRLRFWNCAPATATSRFCPCQHSRRWRMREPPVPRRTPAPLRVRAPLPGRAHRGAARGSALRLHRCRHAHHATGAAAAGAAGHGARLVRHLARGAAAADALDHRGDPGTGAAGRTAQHAGTGGGLERRGRCPTARCCWRMPGPPRPAGADGIDPARLEIFNNLFMHIAEQMGEVLKATAQSVNIRERLDYSCALFDAHGGLVANAPHMPVHLGLDGSERAGRHARAAAPAPRRRVAPEQSLPRRHPPAGHDRRHSGVHRRRRRTPRLVRRLARAPPRRHRRRGAPGSMPPFSRTIDGGGNPVRVLRAGAAPVRLQERGARCARGPGPQAHGRRAARGRTWPTCAHSWPPTRAASRNCSARSADMASPRCRRICAPCRPTPHAACAPCSRSSPAAAFATRWTPAMRSSSRASSTEAGARRARVDFTGTSAQGERITSTRRGPCLGGGAVRVPHAHPRTHSAERGVP